MAGNALAAGRCQRAAGALSLLAGVWLAPLAAQTGPLRWTLDPQSSLAWWQIDPHYNHLWATTCPNDPSWQPGEGRDEGWQVDYSARPALRDADHSELRVPLFPRKRVRPVCSQAVRGEASAADSLRWTGVRASIVVLLDSLVTGYRLRDEYARRVVLETRQYPSFQLTVDSLVQLQATGGDTVRAWVVGSYQLRGVTTPVRFPVTIWREAGGLRVQGQLSFPAKDLVEQYHMSTWALGLGVGLKRWRTVFLGADLLLRPASR